eukprot:TRINITY_DN7166_c0_g1_i3.p1 TRINITY_DN7166_c0_g1~~TRINITY_DN7166_c0_g1_i3.p1  ORF type:complete len:827 (-),score=139.38 TRINITY_DN7166_c0_g1_i3:105-2585(-)
MRAALSNIGLAEKRFQLGQLGDAVEALEILLEYLHKEASQQNSDNCSPTCFVHETFGMNIVDQLICTNKTCGATGEPFAHNVSIVYANTASLRAYHTTHPLSLFEEVLYEISQDLPQTCPNKFCSEKAPICRLLLSTPPLVLSIGLAWDQANASTSMISFIASFIPLTIDLKYLYPNLNSGVHYRLCGVVGYYGLHYNYYASPTKNSPWYIFDDAIVREIGGGWDGVVDKILKGKIQPSILFYEKLETRSSKPPTTPVSQPQSQPSLPPSIHNSVHNTPNTSPRFAETSIPSSAPHTHRTSKDSTPIEIFAQLQNSYNTTSQQQQQPSVTSSSLIKSGNSNNSNSNVNNNNNNSNSSLTSSKNSTHSTTLSKTATLRSRSVPKIRQVAVDDERETTIPAKKEPLPPPAPKVTDTKPPTYFSSYMSSTTPSNTNTNTNSTNNVIKHSTSYTPLTTTTANPISHTNTNSIATSNLTSLSYTKHTPTYTPATTTTNPISHTNTNPITTKPSPTYTPSTSLPPKYSREQALLSGKSTKPLDIKHTEVPPMKFSSVKTSANSTSFLDNNTTNSYSPLDTMSTLNHSLYTRNNDSNSIYGNSSLSGYTSNRTGPIRDYSYRLSSGLSSGRSTMNKVEPLSRHHLDSVLHAQEQKARSNDIGLYSYKPSSISTETNRASPSVPTIAPAPSRSRSMSNGHPSAPNITHTRSLTSVLDTKNQYGRARNPPTSTSILANDIDTDGMNQRLAGSEDIRTRFPERNYQKQTEALMRSRIPEPTNYTSRISLPPSSPTMTSLPDYYTKRMSSASINPSSTTSTTSTPTRYSSSGYNYRS